MEIPASIITASKLVIPLGIIGGGALGLNELHVSAQEFENYQQQQLASDERDYVLELKKNIREVQGALSQDPDEEYLIEALAELVDALCEIRPDDRLCQD